MSWKPNGKVWAALSAAIALAQFIVHPGNSAIPWFCLGIFGCLLYGFSDFPPKANGWFRRAARWGVVVIIGASAAVAIGAIGWNRLPPRPEPPTVLLGDWNTGGPDPCPIFVVALSPTKIALENIDLKIQLPVDIYSFKVGLTQESPKIHYAMAEIGRDKNGECRVVGSPVMVDDPGVKAIQYGPSVFHIKGSQLSSGSGILGFFTPYLDHRRSFSPSVEFSADGTYEYIQNGVIQSSSELNVTKKGMPNEK